MPLHVNLQRSSAFIAREIPGLCVCIVAKFHPPLSCRSSPRKLTPQAPHEVRVLSSCCQAVGVLWSWRHHLLCVRSLVRVHRVGLIPFQVQFGRGEVDMSSNTVSCFWREQVFTLFCPRVLTRQTLHSLSTLHSPNILEISRSRGAAYGRRGTATGVTFRHTRIQTLPLLRGSSWMSLSKVTRELPGTILLAPWASSLLCSLCVWEVWGCSQPLLQRERSDPPPESSGWRPFGAFALLASIVRRVTSCCGITFCVTRYLGRGFFEPHSCGTDPFPVLFAPPLRNGQCLV